MPTDTRRINGPEDTRCPYLFNKSPAVTSSLVNSNGLRHDGRAVDKIRPIFLKVGVISQARGSAYVELEKTKVICSVYGPRQVRQDDFSLTGQISCEFKFATFSHVKRGQHQQDAQEKDYSLIIQQSLEPAVCLDKFPKAQLDVFITVLENDGSALSAAITAASLAVADAGIDMYDVVIGSSLKYSGDLVLMDPTSLEEGHRQPSSSQVMSTGSLTISILPNLNQVSAMFQQGDMTGQSLTQATKRCIESCQKIYPVVQHCLMSSVKDKFRRTEQEGPI